MDIFMRTSDCLFRTFARCVISAPGISFLRIIITDDCCLLAPFAARHNCSSVVGWPPLMMIAWLMITRYLLLDMKLLVLVDLQPATIVFLPPLFVFRPSVLSCDPSVNSSQSASQSQGSFLFQFQYSCCARVLSKPEVLVCGRSQPASLVRGSSSAAAKLDYQCCDYCARIRN